VSVVRGMVAWGRGMGCGRVGEERGAVGGE
jgi:hypothetical protein